MKCFFVALVLVFSIFVESLEKEKIDSIIESLRSREKRCLPPNLGELLGGFGLLKIERR